MATVIGHRPRLGRAQLLNAEGRTKHRSIRFEQNGHAKAFFDLAQPLALAVEQVHGNRGVHMHRNLGGAAARALLLDGAQHLDGGTLRAANQAAALAMRASDEGLLGQARPQPLARHFQQAEMRNAAHLNPRAVTAQRILQPAFHGGVMLGRIHVDEVDNNQPREVPQPKLAGDLIRGLDIGAEGGVLNAALAGGAAGVHVNRHQRLSLVDDDIAARFQLHRGRVHAIKLRLHPVAGKKRRRTIAIELNLARILRHQHAHEVARRLIGLLALNQNLVHVAGIAIADGALDEVGFLIDQRRRGAGQGALANAVP